MTTKELIEKLKEIDPDGNLEVVMDGCYYGCEVGEVIKHESVDEETGEIYSQWIEVRGA